MKSLLLHPILSTALALIWLLLVNSLAPGQVLLGVLLGILIPRFSLRFWPDPVRVRRPWRLLGLGLRLARDILTANLSVARHILRGPAHLRPGFVEVPLELRSPLGISLLANLICLTPGTVSASLSANQRTLLVHALHLEDPPGLVARIKSHYESPLKDVFESSTPDIQVSASC